jgi:hypothetical protein
VRDILAVPVREKEYAPRFVMADFEDRTGLGDEAHLFFRPHASIESFPLPGKQRRWIVLAREGAEAAPGGYLLETVRELAGYDLADSAQYFQSSFRTRRMLAAQFFKGRVLLCGDAAHVMSPIASATTTGDCSRASRPGTISPRALFRSDAIMHGSNTCLARCLRCEPRVVWTSPAAPAMSRSCWRRDFPPQKS